MSANQFRLFIAAAIVAAAAIWAGNGYVRSQARIHDCMGGDNDLRQICERIERNRR